MGFFKGLRQRRTASPEIDLLATAFNLPTRKSIQRASRRGARRIAFTYGSGDESDDNDDTSSDFDPLSSSSSEEEEPEEQEESAKSPKSRRPRRTTLRKGSVPRRRHHSSSSQIQCLKKEKNVRHSSSRSPKSRRTRRRDRRPRTIHRDSSVSSASTCLKELPSPSSSSKHQAAEVTKSVNAPAGIQFKAPTLPSQPPYLAYSQPQVATAPFPGFAGTSQYAAPPVAPAPAFHPIWPPPIPSTMPTGGTPSGKPISLAQELRRIQAELDQNISALQSRPGDVALKSQIRALREQLNLTLNKATKQSPPGEVEQTPMRTPMSHMGTQDKPSATTHDGSKFPGLETENLVDSKQQGSGGRAKNELKADSPMNSPAHHICFGCGSVRSRKYHEKHPLAPGKHLMPSLCEGCRQDVHEAGTMEHHCRHVCFGCGIYRSRRFHKSHPPRPGDPVLVNYCHRCRDDMPAAARAKDSVADSVRCFGPLTVCLQRVC